MNTHQHRSGKPILFSGEMVRAILDRRKTQARRVVSASNSTVDGYSWKSFLNLKHLKFDLATPKTQSIWGPDVHLSVPLRIQGERLEDETFHRVRPRYQRGDRLWVTETWHPCARMGFDVEVEYRSTKTTETRRWDGIGAIDRHILRFAWRPSIFMPRWASRITLEIESVRVERLQDISEEDAIAEGVERTGGGRHWLGTVHKIKGTKKVHGLASHAYRDLWNSINLAPSAVYGRNAAGKKVIVSYQSCPWSLEDFEAAYPGVAEAGLYRGKPINIVPNPWVWVITFKRLPASTN